MARRSRKTAPVDKTADAATPEQDAAAGAPAPAEPPPATDAAATDTTPPPPPTGQATAGAGQPQPQQGQAQLPPDLSAIMGQAAWVMMHSPLHRHLFVQDLEWLLVPPIGLRQFRLWRRDNLPVAFAAWALLSDEAEARYRGGMEAGTRRLAPADWRSGENVWLIDLVCPFGGRDEALQQLKNETFKGRKVKTLQPAPGGKGLAVVEW